MATQNLIPEPTRFSKTIPDVEGHYDLDGVSQNKDAEVVVATQRPVPNEHAFFARIVARLKNRTRQFFSE